VDATNRRSGSQRKILVKLSPAKFLEVVDDGCGLTQADIRDLIGTIGASGTKRAYESHGGPLPIGQFGVGLLSTRNVATTVELFSQSEHGGRGVHWVWNGGATFRSAEVPQSLTVGTRVIVHFREDGVAAKLDERSLARWIRENMPFIEAEVYLEGLPLPLTTPSAPWRWPSDLANDTGRLSAWASEHELIGLKMTVTRSTTFSGGGALIVWPSEHGSYSNIVLYRSGVRVPGAGALLSKELGWLRVVADLPGVEVTLDRASLTPQGQAAASAELDTLAIIGLLRLVVTPTLPEETTVWWSQHRAGLFRALAFALKHSEPSLSAAVELTARLCAWLRFDTAIGALTMDELIAHAGRESLEVSGVVQQGQQLERPAAPRLLIVRWNDEYERVVFHHLATARLLRVVPWTPAHRLGGGLRERLWPGQAVKVAQLVEKVLLKYSKQEVRVALADDFANDADLARWQGVPTSLVQTDGRAFFPRRIRRSMTDEPLELKLNANSPALQMLGDKFADNEPNQAVTWAWALVGWALSKYGGTTPQVSEARRRQYNALFALMDVPPLPTEAVRCFVCYDWALSRPEFDVVYRTLSAPPFSFSVIDAASETRGQHILTNLLAIMQSCHCFISILTPGQGPLVQPAQQQSGATAPGRRAIQEALNANVLLETGVAMALGRPLIVCAPTVVELPVDFDGLLRLGYESASDLGGLLRDKALKLGLDQFGSQGPRNRTSP